MHQVIDLKSPEQRTTSHTTNLPVCFLHIPYANHSSVIIFIGYTTLEEAGTLWDLSYEHCYTSICTLRELKAVHKSYAI